MTEFLHKKYKEFIRNNYGIQSGGFSCSNIEELMCDFATEIAKEYIEMASKLENENISLRDKLQYSYKHLDDIETEKNNLLNQALKKSKSTMEIKHLENCVKSANRDIKNAYENGKVEGYIKAKTWHYVTDELPPNPKENEDGISVQPLNYICVYECDNDGCGGIDYECDEFMYMGNGEWLGENKEYPIYAWLDCAVEVPKPRKENE